MKCKRRGLKIVLTVKDAAGAAHGEGLLRRLAHGPDPIPCSMPRCRKLPARPASPWRWPTVGST